MKIWNWKKIWVSALLVLASTVGVAQEVDSISVWFPRGDYTHTTIVKPGELIFMRKDTIYARQVRSGDTLYYYRGEKDLTNIEVTAGDKKYQYTVDKYGHEDLTAITTYYYKDYDEGVGIEEYQDSLFIKAYTDKAHFETIYPIKLIELYDIDGNYLMEFNEEDSIIEVNQGYYIKIFY